MKDFSFQGKIWLATRLSNGKPGSMRWVDDASQLSIKLQTDTDERNESYSGQRLTSVRIAKAKKATFTLVINAANKQNMALAFQGTSTDVVGGSVTGETFPTGLVANDVIALDYPRVSAVALTDSAGTPATLVAGTNYSVESSDAGFIKIINPATFTQPFKAAYTYAAHVNMAAFTLASVEKYLVMDGINTVDNEHVRVKVYRMSFNPVDDFGLITDGLGNISLSGSILYDSVNAANANLGGFLSVQLPSEV